MSSDFEVLNIHLSFLKVLFSMLIRLGAKLFQYRGCDINQLSTEYDEMAAFDKLRGLGVTETVGYGCPDDVSTTDDSQLNEEAARQFISEEMLRNISCVFSSDILGRPLLHLSPSVLN